MYQKRMAEIEARKAEIAQEIAQADEARTQELDAEVDGLNQELTMLRAKLAVAGKVKPLPGRGGKPVDRRPGSPCGGDEKQRQDHPDRPGGAPWPGGTHPACHHHCH